MGDNYYELNEAAVEYYHTLLKSPQGKAGMDYLRSINITEETIEKFRIGYTGEESDGLVKYLRAKRFSQQEIIDAGLAIRDNKEIIDKFQNRIMIPVMDNVWKTVGFYGRIIGSGMPIYLVTPETSVFHPREILFGLNVAKDTKEKYMILCEGPMDVIALHQAGFDMAVAFMGTVFTYSQAGLLKRYTDDVLLAFDNDEAGHKARIRAENVLGRCQISGYVLDLKGYMDPYELLKKAGKEAFADCIEKKRWLVYDSGIEDFLKIKKDVYRKHVKKNQKNHFLSDAIKTMFEKKNLLYDLYEDEYEDGINEFYYVLHNERGLRGIYSGSILVDDENGICVSVTYPGIRVNPKTRREMESLIYRINNFMVFGKWQIRHGAVMYVRCFKLTGESVSEHDLMDWMIYDALDTVAKHEASLIQVELGSSTVGDEFGDYEYFDRYNVPLEKILLARI